MGGSRQATARRPGRRAPPSQVDLLEAKLTPPVTRPGTVVRADLVDRLRASRAVPLVSIMAPPGYGKTTLMATWQDLDDRPFAWVSVDDSDNDPITLLTYVAAALDRSEPVDPRVFSSLSTPTVSIELRVVARLGSALAYRQRPVVLVLDDIHGVTNTECTDALAWLSRHVPSGSQLALAGRREPDIPLARLRTQGRLLELGANDLALDVNGARALLRGAGVDPPLPAVEELQRQTEGWPAGLYLAALSLRAQQHNGEQPRFGGGDRFVVDYLWSEILSRLSADDVEFLTRTSVLDRMCGPLCDAVLDSSGSGAFLQELERSNRFVIPLDRNRHWYRYHHLFRDALAAELAKQGADLERELHRRAADWLEHSGMPEQALGHAFAASDMVHATDLFQLLAAPLVRRGRLATVMRWVERFPEGAVTEQPALAATVAWAAVLSGDSAAADRWADLVEHQPVEEERHDDLTALVAPRHLLLVTMCRHGMERMLDDARLAVEQQPPGGPWQALALFELGVATLFNGDPTAADTIFGQSAELAEHTGADPAYSMALAERSLLAISRDDWSPAAAYAEGADRGLEAAGLEEMITSAITFAALARCALRRGDVNGARRELTRAQRLRPILTRAIPWLAVQTRLELARVNFALSDRAGARMLLTEIVEILAHVPDMGTLGDDVADLRHTLDARQGRGLPGPSALTTAELRLLALLPTHLSFPEIGERLYVSPNTVKTQAISIYRKLGASSRSEAVEGARRIGLLGP